MDTTTRASALFIAVAVLIAGVYVMRDILAPFAIAVFLWLVMDGFAKAIERRIPFTPRAVALLAAVGVVVAGAVAVVAVIGDAATEFAARSTTYQQRLDQVIVQLYGLVGRNDAAPTISQLFETVDLRAFLTDVAQTVQGLASNALFVFIYVAFLFAAQAQFPRKLDAVFTDSEQRERARTVISAVRQSIERYLWVQTLLSILTSVLSYATLKFLGLDNALFWAFLIFLLNYVPTIGSIIATALPTIFALVQYSTLWEPAAVLAGVGFWQFTIGNFMQPRMQGQNLNLATIVVLLGLAIWGAIWGLAGMFLSAPLTVMVMVVLAQFSSTRWIAVLLSADGRPDGVTAAGAERREPPVSAPG